MKLFMGIYITALCMSQFSFQVSATYLHHRSLIHDPNDWFERLDVESLNPAAKASGPEEGIANAGDLPELTQAKRKPQIIDTTSLGKIKGSPQFLRKPITVKFIVRDGFGNVEKEEQVGIPAYSMLPVKLQRVLESNDGYITVVYRGYKGLLTRIEKLRLPEHLPKETIPAGGLVIIRSELPWEPSVNSWDFEAEEAGDTKPLNTEYQNIDEKPSSGPTNAVPEVRYGSPPQVQQSDTVYTVRKPVSLNLRRAQERYVRPKDARAPLRLKTSGA